LHLQVKLPTVFVHVACAPQGLVLAKHSLESLQHWLVEHENEEQATALPTFVYPAGHLYVEQVNSQHSFFVQVDPLHTTLSSAPVFLVVLPLQTKVPHLGLHTLLTIW